VQVCGNNNILGGGPMSQPPGATPVAAGDNSTAFVNLTQNTTYWFEPGVHTLGTDIFSQIIPKNGDTFIGAPGAVIDGQNMNDYAFTGLSTGVTIEYLTVQNFGQPGGNNNEGVVNHDSASDWTIEYNTVTHDAGAGVMVGSGDVLSYNCLSDNGQYGLSAFSANGVSNVVVTDNEIAGNDTDNWEARIPECGCSGGGKFWATVNATVEDNYVHNNLNVGLWVDTDNAGFNFTGNYFSNNWNVAIIYEISYNAAITYNTFVDNGWGEGPTDPGIPSGAIYVSESGGDSRVASNYSGTFDITNNDFVDNWGGVVLWENANRYCGSPFTLDHVCTLVDPSVYTVASCQANLTATSTATDDPDYFDNCRWKTQNVSVTNNTFNFNPANIGADCTADALCGYVGVFSEFGEFGSPYPAWTVPNNISNNQNNVFADNTYNGPWSFMGVADGDTLTWSQWSSGVDDVNFSGVPFAAQDAGSTYNT
jgi:hypothetical protein